MSSDFNPKDASTQSATWIVWMAVHIYFLIGFTNRFFVILQWGIAFLTRRRQVRVFPGEEKSAKEAQVPSWQRKVAELNPRQRAAN